MDRAGAAARLLRDRPARVLPLVAPGIPINTLAQQGGQVELAPEVLEQAVAACEAVGGRLALLVVQVDQLEKVATALGPRESVGLAAEFCARIRAALRDKDLVLPVGDRRFWIILNGPRNQGHAELAASKFSRVGKGPFRVGEYTLRLDITCGIALFPDHAADAAGLARCAELALASARDAGSAWRTYSDIDERGLADLWEVEHEFDRALEDAEFELYFQPKVDVRSGVPCGAEALLRWNNPSRGLLASGAFLPIAEKTGRMEAITWFVIDSAQRQRSEWPERWGRLPVAVNIPPSVLDSGKLQAYLQDSMRIWGTQPNDLILEITEDAVVRNPKSSFAALAQLRREGVRVAIDDFGSGYSSMTYFKDMPADELKIDRSFTLDLDHAPANRHIVRSIIDLAHLFDYKVVAEGVETPAVLALLGEMGCDVAQGFHFARPCPQAEFIRWLTDHPER